jgi:hypothetical protein
VGAGPPASGSTETLVYHLAGLTLLVPRLTFERWTVRPSLKVNESEAIIDRAAALLPRLPVSKVCAVIESGRVRVSVPVGVVGGVCAVVKDVLTQSKVTVVALAATGARLVAPKTANEAQVNATFLRRIARTVAVVTTAELLGVSIKQYALRGLQVAIGKTH